VESPFTHLCPPSFLYMGDSGCCFTFGVAGYSWDGMVCPTFIAHGRPRIPQIWRRHALC
jgi:hypothetical protein